MKTSKNSKKLT